MWEHCFGEVMHWCTCNSMSTFPTDLLAFPSVANLQRLEQHNDVNLNRIKVSPLLVAFCTTCLLGTCLRSLLGTCLDTHLPCASLFSSLLELTSMDRSTSHTEVQLPGITVGPLLAWSPTNNLLAWDATDNTGTTSICTLEPSCPQVYCNHGAWSMHLAACLLHTLRTCMFFCAQEHAVLDIPAAPGAEERLLSLQWSPANQRALLLAASSTGRCLVWAQPPADQCQDGLISISDWHCHEACCTAAEPGVRSSATKVLPCMHGARMRGPRGKVTLSMHYVAVAVRWLEEPSPWKWPAANSGNSPTHGIESRFGPHLPGPGSPKAGPGLHWARLGTLAFACVLQDASVQVPLPFLRPLQHACLSSHPISRAHGHTDPPASSFVPCPGS